MKRLESNQREQSWLFCPLHFTGVNCWRQDFRIVPFSYLLRMYDSIHLDQVYRKGYIRNIVKILLSRGRHVHLKTCKQKKNSVDEIADASGDFPLGFLNALFYARVSSIDAFSFSSLIVLLEMDCSSKAFTENLSKSFLQRPNLRQKLQKRFPFFKHWY